MDDYQNNSLNVTSRNHVCLSLQDFKTQHQSFTMHRHTILDRHFLCSKFALQTRIETMMAAIFNKPSVAHQNKKHI